MARRLMAWVAVVVLALAFAAGRNGYGGGGGFGGGGAGAGGIQMDPEFAEQMQQMTQIGVQVITNMQQGGDDPMQFVMGMVQQIQDGTFDPDAVQQQLVDKGYMTQDMLQQVQGIRSQMQVSTQRMVVNSTYQRIRQLLNPTDDEWAILLPKVQRVLAAQAEVAQGGDTLNQRTAAEQALGVGGGGGNALRMLSGGFMSQMGGPQGSATELGRAWVALQTAAEDKQVGEAMLSARLATWRQLHDRARAELKAAQEDLMGVLTLRQEAVMILAGVL